MDATIAGSSNAAFDVVKKDHLAWLHAKTLTGQFINAPIRFGNPHFMRINDQVGHLIKMVALLLSAPGANKAIADDGGLIARTQAAEVGSKLDVECPKIFFPEVSHK